SASPPPLARPPLASPPFALAAAPGLADSPRSLHPERPPMTITPSLLLGAAILCMAAPPALAGARGGQRNTARQAARTTRPASTRPARRQIRPQRQTLMRGQRQRQNLGGNRARGE